MADGHDRNFDFEGARRFDRERVRREAETAFRTGSAETFHRADFRNGDTGELSLKELLRDLVGEGRRLLRAEFGVARAELKAEAKKAGAGTAMLVAGATFALLAGMTLVAMFIAALLPVMKLWVACLVVGLGLLAITAVLANSGLKALKKVKAERTIHSLKEDGQWASETLRAAKQQTHGHA